jgi:hypothetical protein
LNHELGGATVGELGRNVLGGFLAAFAFAIATAVWQWFRRPLYIPFEEQNWSNATRVMLQQAGFDPSEGNAGWIINYMVEDSLEEGRQIVRAGRWPCKREVRARRKEGHAVLMKQP